MHKVFSYVVATDVGVAPNVDGGVGRPEKPDRSRTPDNIYRRS